MGKMLENSQVEVSIGNNSIVINTIGCPQGGVITVLMRSTAVDELLEQLTNTGI